ncbi:tetratricopeptide repeat protein [Actinoplanes sp. NPDC023936]|uniref:tetratricopeptide repeat protein n=1 Tax=Actinoplanes sp. NPDC023936 TaxID=3154910 RepID=UPI00340936CA
MNDATLDPRLRGSLPDIAYDQLELWLRNRRFRLRLEDPLTTGFTDAVVAVVAVRTGSGDHRLVMKYLRPSERTRADFGTLMDAVTYAPRPFRDHLVRPWPEGPVTVEKDSIIMFMEYAAVDGRSLEPLRVLLNDDRLGKACATVVKHLVRDWNRAADRQAEEMPADDMLTGLAERTCRPRGALYTWLKQNWPELLKPSCAQLPGGAGLPNPVHLVMRGGDLAARPMIAFRGHCHGDLHGENILMPSAGGGLRARDFRLIDMSTYRPDGFVAYDPAYLLCSILARRGADLPDDSAPLVDLVLGRRGAGTGAFPPEVSDAARRIARTCKKLICVNGWTEAQWTPNFLLSLTAAALIFAGRPDIRSRWFLTFAARTAQEALNLLPPRPVRADHRRPSWSRLITDPPAGVLVLAGSEGIGKSHAIRSAMDSLAERAGADLVVPRPIDIHLGSAFGAADLVAELQRALGETPAPVTGGGPRRPNDLLLGRLDPLLARAAGRRVVIAIDSADRLIDPTRTIRDANLGDVLHQFTSSDNRTVSVVLVGREAPEPAHNPWVDEFAIESFESEFDAAQLRDFLRRLDRNEVHRLSGVEENTWGLFRDRIHGNPRAAELAFALLDSAETEFADLARIAGHLDGVAPDRVIDVLHDAVLRHLDEGPRAVLRALAIYRIPVDAAAVHAVLGPGSSVTAIRRTLLGLAGRGLIRKLGSERFYLQPPDDRRVLPQQGFAQLRRDLGRRACAHLAGRRPDPIRRLPDLWADRARVDILLDGGEFDQAATLMDEIERKYLLGWGYGWLLTDQRVRLRAHLTGVPKLRNLNWLAQEYQELRRFDEAQEHFTEALALATGPYDVRNRGKLLNNLAGVHFQRAGCGDTDDAITRYDQALSLARLRGRARDEIAPLEGLADCARRRGDFSAAKEHLERALDLAGGPGRRTGQVHGLLLKLARRHVECGEYDVADRRLRQIAATGAEPGNPATACHLYDIDADRLLAVNRSDMALLQARRAANLAVDIGDPRVFVQARTTMAAIYVAELNFAEARHHIDVAARRRHPGHSLAVLGIQALALSRQGAAESADVFRELRTEAFTRRDIDRADFGAWDLEGFAICGLHMNGGADLTEALTAFGHARDICRPAGLIDRLARLLTSLDAGTGRLAPAIAAARGETGS